MSITKTKAKPVEQKDIDLYKKDLDGHKSISERIRFLNSKGMKTGDISRLLTEYEKRLVRFQWVRNVLITPVKKPTK